MLIIPGKIPYIKRANLKIAISAGIMFDQQRWLPSEYHDAVFGDQYPARYDSLVVTVSLNEEILAKKNLRQPLQIDHDFLDTEEVTEHCLTIAVRGFDQQHYEQSRAFGKPYPTIKIHCLEIEQLNMMQTIQDLGTCVYHKVPATPSCYMSQNGYQSLSFTTPIYAWLLENDHKPDYYL
jgi:hypothetical protein